MRGESEYVGVSALAGMCGLSRRTLLSLTRRVIDPLPSYQPATGGKVLVRVSEFDAWMHRQRRRQSVTIDKLVEGLLP